MAVQATVTVVRAIIMRIAHLVRDAVLIRMSIKLTTIAGISGEQTMVLTANMSLPIVRQAEIGTETRKIATSSNAPGMPFVIPGMT